MRTSRIILTILACASNSPQQHELAVSYECTAGTPPHDILQREDGKRQKTDAPAMSVLLVNERTNERTNTNDADRHREAIIKHNDNITTGARDAGNTPRITHSSWQQRVLEYTLSDDTQRDVDRDNFNFIMSSGFLSVCVCTCCAEMCAQHYYKILIACGQWKECIAWAYSILQGFAIMCQYLAGNSALPNGTLARTHQTHECVLGTARCKNMCLVTLFGMENSPRWKCLIGVQSDLWRGVMLAWSTLIDFQSMRKSNFIGHWNMEFDILGMYWEDDDDDDDITAHTLTLYAYALQHEIIFNKLPSIYTGEIDWTQRVGQA